MNKAQEDWYKENRSLGVFLGYPPCCIREFGMQPPKMMERTKPTKDDKRRFKAAHVDGFFTGFIPCVRHAKMILNGEATLRGVLVNRNKEAGVFPNY